MRAASRASCAPKSRAQKSTVNERSVFGVYFFGFHAMSRKSEIGYSIGFKSPTFSIHSLSTPYSYASDICSHMEIALVQLMNFELRGAPT